MTEKELLKRSGFYTSFILFFVSLFWFLFSIQTSFGGYTGGPASGIDTGINSRSTSQANWQVGSSGVYVLRLGIENVTGSGSAGYMTGTNTYYPRIEWTSTLGTFNFVGTGSYPVTLQMNGVAIPSAGSVTVKLDAVNGVGTNNTFNNPTLAGVGTITASFGANGLVITPTEYASVNNSTGELQSQINSKQATLINNSPGTITNVLGYTPIANTQGSTTSALGYTPIANTQGSITTALGYTPPANTLGSITTALGYTPTDLGNTIELGTETTGNTNNISEGSTNKYYTNARVVSAVGSESVNIHNDVSITDWTDGYYLKINGSGQVVSGSSSTSVGFDSVTGSVTANTELAKLLGNMRLLVPGTTTSLAGTNSSSYVLYNKTTPITIDNSQWGSSSAFVDFSGSNRIATVIGNAIGTSTGAKFGRGGFFDNSGDSVRFADDNVFTSTGNFFCRFWYTPINTAATASLCGHYSTDGGMFINFNNIPNQGIRFFLQANGGATIVALNEGSNTNWATGTARFIEISRSGNDYFLFVGGTIVGSTTTASAWFNPTNPFHVGGNGDWGDPTANGTIDDFIWNDGTAGHTSNYTPPTVPEWNNLPAGTDLYLTFDEPELFTYNRNTLQVFPPGTTTASLQIRDDGTYTTSIITSVQGKLVVGSSTESGTTTVYIAEFDGAVKASVFNETSTKRVKENIEDIKIKPNLLDAEAEAKYKYIADNKVSWFANNQANYIYVGTNTVTHIDDIAMEKDYAKYIELQWASDLNRDTYIQGIQKAYEKSYWKKFDALSPKSWNPIGKPNITHRGFVAEELPDEFKGDDKNSVALCALIAFTVKSSQELKADTVFTLKILKELITTGTVTQQKIDYISERLEVLNP